MGLISSLIPGLIAYFSYAAWQGGRKRAPWFAWFYAAYVAAVLIPVVLAAATGSSDDTLGDSIGWILIFAVAVGLAVMFLMSRAGPSRRTRKGISSADGSPTLPPSCHHRCHHS